MSSYRLSRTAGEKLLEGGAEQAELAHFLAVAAAPGTATELRGESAAQAAFISAVTTRPLLVDELRSSPVRARTLSRIVVAKAIAALALTAGAGGVAVAATSTTLPMDQPESTTTHTAVPAASPESDAPAADGTSDTDTEPTDSADANGGNGLIGLCRAWAAGVGSNPHAVENPAFTRLTTAAGAGTSGGDVNDAVAGFCATVTPDHPSPGRPTATPSAVGEPATEPTEGVPASGKPKGGPAGEKPAKPDRPDKSATGKPDRANGKSGASDDENSKPDASADNSTGQSDNPGSKAEKRPARG